MVETPTAEKPGPVEEVVEEPEKPKAEKLKITESVFQGRELRGWGAPGGAKEGA